MNDFGPSGVPGSQEALLESKARQRRLAIKETLQDDSGPGEITDESRELRHALGGLCERYLLLLADKDTLDFRLGSADPYEDGSMPAGGAERAYEDDSKAVSETLRQVVGEIVETGRRIQAIESF